MATRVEEVLKATRALSVEERRAVLKVLSTDVISAESALDIKGLEGLGSDVWEGVDPDAYLRAERDSWGH